MTEPDRAGSNPTWLDTRAERDGDEWVDNRDVAKRLSAPSENKPVVDDGPKFSRYGRAGNKMLMKLMTSLGPFGESLPHILNTKNRIVDDAENAYMRGEGWSDEEFLDVLESGLRKAIRDGSEEARSVAA